MRLLIFGATGVMGILLARRFLVVHPGCTLILYARDPSKIPEDLATDRAVIVIEGKLDEADNLSKAMEGVDTVITALGPTGRKGPRYPRDTPIAAAYSRIILAMKVHGVRRLIALTTPSVRDPQDQFSLPLVFLRTTFAALARNVVRDIVAVGRTVRTEGADLEWTLVRLALHSGNEDDPNASKEVIAGYMGDGRIKAVSNRVGAAAFIIDELEKREWIQRAPILSTP